MVFLFLCFHSCGFHSAGGGASQVLGEGARPAAPPLVAPLEGADKKVQRKNRKEKVQGRNRKEKVQERNRKEKVQGKNIQRKVQERNR